MADRTLISVNEHCLDNVMKLAQTREVTASEDIYDAHGTKLLTKGGRISLAMKERLICHKLRKPLETSLCVADSITEASVLAEAKSLLEDEPALKVFMGDKQPAILETVSQIPLHPAAALLLTVADNSRGGIFRHGVLVSLISVSLGTHHGMNHSDRMVLALAGLLHDIGELYICPDYFHTQRALRLEEWKHVAAHPRIGQIVLGELTNYSQMVIDAVAGHHERLDGSGYPRQLSGERISPATQIVSMAETLSGIIVHRDDVLIRSCLALKSVPGEHSNELISIFSTLRKSYAGEPFPTGTADVQTTSSVRRVTQTLGLVFAECERIEQMPSLPPAAVKLLDHVKNRMAGLRRALKAAGVEECFDEDGLLVAFTQEDREIFLEIDIVGKEIGWRLRDAGRDLYLRLGELSPDVIPAFAVLFEILGNSGSD